jgi:ATP-dependent Clp protease adapter protein ClpS
MAATTTKTDKKPDSQVRSPWHVVLYNDDVHTIDEVVLQVQKATGKNQDEAYRITMEAHASGRSVVWRGDFTRCQQVAGVLRLIRLQVEVDEG